MGETILCIVVLLLSLYGCVELVRAMITRILRPGKETSGVLLLPLSGHRSDVEFIVQSAATRNRWLTEFSEQVLLLDLGMDEETRLLAENACRQFENVRLSTPQDLEKMFDSGLQ